MCKVKLESVWVSASAGTGKTKMLIDRLVKMLANGVMPETILCITYTNAAVNEIYSRLLNALFNLSKKSDNEIFEFIEEINRNEITEEKEIRNEKKNSDIKFSQIIFQKSKSFKINSVKLDFLKKDDDNQKIFKIKNLYNEIISSPPKICTIHSFSKDLLSNFSLEKNCGEEVEIFEEAEKEKTIKEIIKNILELKNYESEILEKHLEILLTNFSKEKFEKMICELINNKNYFKKFLIHNHLSFHEKKIEDEDYINKKIKSFENKLINYFFEEGIYDYSNFEKNEEKIFLLSKKMLESKNLKKTDETKLKNVCNKNYCLAFLTKDQKRQKNFLTNELKNEFKSEINFFNEFRELFYKKHENEIIQKTIQNSVSIIFCAEYILTEYELSRNGREDFEDILLNAEKILEKSFHDEKIKKLIENSMQIEHIFLDEAQDTSAIQWEIIKKLFDFFFINEKNTLFVVGDLKQSIYSFQGAEPKLFFELQDFFEKKIIEIHGTFKKINLNDSFRTSQNILSVVDEVFNEDRDGVIFNNEKLNHFSKKKFPGFISGILVKEANDDKEINSEKENSEIYFEEEEGIKGEEFNLVSFGAFNVIKKLLNEKIFLQNKNKILEPSDIMILSRSRNNVLNDLIQLLKNEGINVSDLDKIKISKNELWQSLIYLLKFFLDENDDYNFYNLLKSPIMPIPFSSFELDVIFYKKTSSLYSLICKSYENLISEIKKNSNKENFDDEFEKIIIENKPNDLKIFFEKFKSENVTDENFKTLINFFYLQSLLKIFKKINDSDNFFKFIYFICDSLIFKFISFNDDKINFQNAKKSIKIINFFYDEIFKFFSKNSYNIKSLIINISENESEIFNKGETHGIKVLTVHGSKGLESPVVILLDDEFNFNFNEFIKIKKDSEELFIIKPNLDDSLPPKFSDLIQKEKDGMKEENMRLLYVGMTRASDILISIGKKSKVSWNNFIINGIKKLNYENSEEAINEKIILEITKFGEIKKN